MPKSYTNLAYHIVYATKDRKNLIADAMRLQLHEYLGGVIRGEGGKPIRINGTANHIHVLAKLRQDKAVSDVVRAIKANTSKWIKRTFPTNATFAWQDGYGAFTVSQSQIDRVRRYVENQETHHRQTTFEEEFVALLKAHGIEFDERYLWV